MEAVGRSTLRKARFFLAGARAANPNDPESVAAHLEAAIVFARSVTFHLQSQFARAPGFAAWYAEQQAGLAARPLCRFLLQQRNFVLKVGPAAVSRVISLSLTESVTAYGEVSVKIIRG